jgi:hypothetical protein
MGNTSGKWVKADRNSLDMCKSSLGAGKKISGPVEPLGDNDARVMWHPLMSCRFEIWHNMSLTSLQGHLDARQ